MKRLPSRSFALGAVAVGGLGLAASWLLMKAAEGLSAVAIKLHQRGF